MFKKILALLLVSFVCNAVVSAKTGQPKYRLIIDTDGAIDDMRAISMFLAQNNARVLAITCSQGTLAPDSISFEADLYINLIGGYSQNHLSPEIYSGNCFGCFKRIRLGNVSCN